MRRRYEAAVAYISELSLKPGHILRVAPKSDTFVLLTCFFLTVIFDMVVSVAVGVMLAALLFMRRMADISHAKLIGDAHPALDEPLPRGVLLYEIAGPLFFGATQKAMSALETVRAPGRVVSPGWWRWSRRSTSRGGTSTS